MAQIDRKPYDMISQYLEAVSEDTYGGKGRLKEIESGWCGETAGTEISPKFLRESFFSV
jgi:hypothetical protein